MKITVTVKDTDNVIGAKEEIAARLEDIADVERIDVNIDALTREEFKTRLWELVSRNDITITNQNIDWLVHKVYLESADRRGASELIREEAIKEFAERLKRFYSSLNGQSATPMIAYHVDQIAKELIGGQK